MESHIDEPSLLSFCNLHGFEREAATALFAIIKKELGGKPSITANDFMCLHKYLDKSIMEIHRWASQTKGLFP
jgi:hypothetical protein